MKPERIGILTGGGDCPGLNAVIRAVVKSATRLGWETLGFHGGYEGLLAPVTYRTLDHREMGALLTAGGTVLGTSNRGRFSAKAGHGEKAVIPRAILDEAKSNFDSLGLRGLICVGGDGSLTIAQALFEHGIPVVGVPKTIDNDALDRLHTTAASHDRVMVLEVMGRYAGWIASHAGIAGGGDIILIPEIPFNYDSICRKIAEREAMGRLFTLIVVAEGARAKGGEFVAQEGVAKDHEIRLGGIGAVVANEVGKRTGKETRVVVLGHLQRGGGPTTFDRLLCTRFGVKAVQLVQEGKFGYMVASRPPDTVAVPITEAIGRLRTVPPEGDIVRTARALGISFGAD
jgi:6-phosphofructokinase 1